MIRRITMLLAAVTMTLLFTGTSLAHKDSLTGAELAYVKRDGLMHLIRAQRYILQEMLIGKREVDQDEFVRAADSLAALFSMIPSTFEDNVMVEGSRAKPEIWENWEDFVFRAESMRMTAAEIAAMAEIRGAEATLEKVRLLYCGECHDLYRE